MASKSPRERKRVSTETYRLICRFFRGDGSVVGGPQAVASLHHLNGDPSESCFPNLIPLGQDFHNGLKQGLSLADLRAEITQESLERQAEEHFRQGRFTHAYGCLRLALAISVHFVRQSERDAEKELHLLAQCLYFLRRCLGTASPELVYDNLAYLLTREVACVRRHSKVASGFGSFCLLIELASWLNEGGKHGDGLVLLRQARRRLRLFHSRMRPRDTSRFFRQLANALNNMGDYSAEFDAALTQASDADPSENGRIGLHNTRLFRHLNHRQPNAAMAVLRERFHHYEKETAYFFSPVTRLEPIITMSLGYIALSLLCESQFCRSERTRRMLDSRLEALKLQEQKLGVSTMLQRAPGLDEVENLAAARVPGMRSFLSGRQFPILPAEVVQTISAVARRL